MIQIAKKQITLIKIAQKQLGIDDGTYRDMLHCHFKVRSCTKLSYNQASLFIGVLKQKGFNIRRKRKSSAKRSPTNKGLPRKKGNVVRLASRGELDKIGVLTSLIHWRVKDGFTAWLGKRFSIARVRTAQEAYRVIEGLKKMFENQMKSQHGENWWESACGGFDDPWVKRYIEEHSTKELKNS